MCPLRAKRPHMRIVSLSKRKRVYCFNARARAAKEENLQARAMTDQAPVDYLYLVTPYPHGLATDTKLHLKEIAAGRPCVLHLFTG